MEINKNGDVRDRDKVMKQLANTEFGQLKSEQEVFAFLKYWNDRIPGTIEHEKLEELVNSVNQERFGKVKPQPKPWEIEGDTIYRKLAKGFIEEQPFFYDTNGIWWMWNNSGHFWLMVDEVDLMVAVDKWTRIESEKSAFKHSLMEALKKQGRQNEPKRAPKTWIQFRDTLVDIKDNSEFKATPEYFITNPIPWRLGDIEHTPTIDKIFKEWMVGGDQDESYLTTLYEIAAFCLLPDYPLHRIICFIGTGCNGKGSFIRLLERFVGRGNYTSSDIHTLANRVFESAKLYRKLLCTIGEIDKAIFRKTSLLKRLTGQDTIGFEIKRKTPFDGNNYAKIVIATNTLPETVDKSDGFYRRWLIVDFPNKFEETRDVVETIPEVEFENLARKSVGALRALLERGRFTNEGSIEQRRQKYEKRSNMLDAFIAEYTNKDTDHALVYSDLYERFIDYLKSQGLRQQSKVEFSKALAERGYEVRKMRFASGVLHGVYGLTWKDELEDFETDELR